MQSRWHVAILGLALAGCATKSVVPRSPAIEPRYKPAVEEFQRRVTAYQEVRKGIESGLPKLKPTPEAAEINAHQKALATGLLKARAGAKQGDLFFPEVREYFVTTVRSEMKGRQGTPARGAAAQGNPKLDDLPGSVKVAVNAPYPDTQPVSSVPPTLLLRLPKLPENLSYRFVGRDLILRDGDAAIIVDFIRDAAPPLPKKTGD
jgi:hypothetical protein